MEQDINEDNNIQVIDDTPYLATRKLYKVLSDKQGRSDLEEDKFHTYGMFLEDIDNGTDEFVAIRNACELMDENVRERLNDDMKLLVTQTDYTIYKNESEMIQFIEAFLV